MSMLADIAEVVIGVDTHEETHTAALIDSRTGAVWTGPLSTPIRTDMPR